MVPEARPTAPGSRQPGPGCVDAAAAADGPRVAQSWPEWISRVDFSFAGCRIKQRFRHRRCLRSWQSCEGGALFQRCWSVRCPRGQGAERGARAGLASRPLSYKGCCGFLLGMWFCETLPGGRQRSSHIPWKCYMNLDIGALLEPLPFPLLMK